ncbi:ubiquinone/menaquinone biosynthesis methyltransferase [Gordonia spumicola]|uniref:Ubiquinone/menaquinone biosynthesis methyltransferase n=1 Tax=Gordonia spumicola TaxID=589161 RepID=A0A7I9V395_9ACTN|nr:class I SAM-dependent methyltransferase [Gordonia spumicola]GED99887.1 ubiquinone/menaquinone biosynthesis methyltransferase [Gordonia spumicola]
MTDDQFAQFMHVHSGLPREAPGSEETLDLLLRLAGSLPADPRIVDVGCGPGAAAVPLAVKTGGTVIGVDLHEPFLADLASRADAAGVADRVTGLAASMESLPLEPGSVDLLWAEGSIYIMGFDAGLAAWRELLSDDGVIVLTECEWLTDTPSDEAREFWAAYEGMRSTPANVAAAWDAGYRVIATYVLPDSDWDAYYVPLAARIDKLRAEGFDPDVLDAASAEIGVRARNASDFAYTAYVLKPR